MKYRVLAAGGQKFSNPGFEKLRPAADRLHRLTSSPPRRRELSILADKESGAAHGRAGAALALLRWAQATGEVRFRTAGEVLIRKDLEVQEAIRRNPPPKDDGMHPSGPLKWCRGTVGIAMVALAADPPVLDPINSQWVRNIAREIALTDTYGDLSLCHGALGRLEFLSLARRRGLLDDRSKAVAGWRRALLGQIVDGHRAGDAMHRMECAGLMLGWAGTGFALLRGALGDNVPSVLVLDDPQVR